MSSPLVVVDGVEVRIGTAMVLPRIDLTVAAGEVVVVHGPSGSGKTTLLGVLAGWLDPTVGRVHWGPPLDGLDGPGRGQWSRTAVVPQLLGLLPELSLVENVAVAHRLAGAVWGDARAAALASLASVGIGELADRRPDEVSLGQQQRAAVARALTGRPALVLADEPSAHLDATTTRLVLDALRQVAAAGSAVVVASHDPVVLAAADRRLALGSDADVAAAGRVVSRRALRRRRAAGTPSGGRPA